MIGTFDINRIADVEFFVCIEPEEEEVWIQVPVSIEVKTSLKEMLIETLEHWRQFGGDWEEFEFAEKYGGKEKLRVKTNLPELEKLRSIFELQNCIVNAAGLSDPKNIIYYFVSFTDANGTKIVAVRRATQMKGLLCARNRLVRWIDDTLKLVDEDVFRLDTDFDFIIEENFAYILRPVGLEYIADVDAYTKERAREKALALGGKLPFLDFSSIAEYVSGHKRAARLVASLSVRPDLERIDKIKLMDWAVRTGVKFRELDDKVVPEMGQEIAFLELLDYRRYEVDLIAEQPAAFVASSRKPAK